MYVWILGLMPGDVNGKAGSLAPVWVLAQGEDIAPIPGTTRQAHLEENLAALDIQLAHDELVRIDEIAPQGIASGERYPEMAMKAVNG